MMHTLGLQLGTRVDRYTLVSPLGEGGQASVWKASDALDGATRAVKLVALKLASASEVERLRNEARVLAKLRHPSLCRCYGMFEDLQHEVVGFAMDFVAGRTLGEVLEDPRFNRTLRERAMLHVARALAHVHGSGAVHRDIKLSNVIVDETFFAAPDETAGVKLVDFGIAALDGMRQRLTATGHAVGTPAYMAPEQIDPTHWGVESAGPRADLFAFGILCWRVFIGGHPTGLAADAGIGDYLMAYREAAKHGAWPPRMAAKGAVRATRRCLALRPDDRFADARELVVHLEQALGLAGAAIDETGAHAIPRAAPAAGTTVEAATRERAAGSGAATPPSSTIVLAPRSGAPEGPDIDTEPSGPSPESLHLARLAAESPPRRVEAPQTTQPDVPPATVRVSRMRWWLVALAPLAAAVVAVLLVPWSPATPASGDDESVPISLTNTSPVSSHTPLEFEDTGAAVPPTRATSCLECPMGRSCRAAPRRVPPAGSW